MNASKGKEKKANEQSKLDIDRHRDDDVQNDIWTTMKLNKATLKRIKNTMMVPTDADHFFLFFFSLAQHFISLSIFEMVEKEKRTKKRALQTQPQTAKQFFSSSLTLIFSNNCYH